MRLFELFRDPSIGPFCIVEYVLEAHTGSQFVARTLLMFALVLPMFCFVAIPWMLYQMPKERK